MEQYLQQVFADALQKVGATTDTAATFEIPQNESHGDLSTNVALKIAKGLKRAPRDLAKELIDAADFDSTTVERVEIAGPGFINITFSKRYYAALLDQMLKQGAMFGRTTINTGKSVNIEWVSANPTGRLHAGHGRNVALGAALANLLEWTGFEVIKEYYFNDAGNQVRNLALSVQTRYFQQLGDDIALGEDLYHGEEIVEIARDLVRDFKDSKRDAPLSFFQNYGLEWNFRDIKETLERLNIRHDVFFNEKTLYETGQVESLIKEFRDRGLAYDKDGAVWLKLSEMGEKDDRVIVKSTGEPTYRLPDMCYHREKLSRGYDLLVDIFGADHIATIPDVLAAVRALGFDTGRVKVVLHQMVTFVSQGEVIKFSKRRGGNYLLADLLDDVGPDASMFFFNMRAAGSHLEFDVELAKEQSEKNPVYYLQYAHARIASILRFAEQENVTIDPESSDVDLSVLTHPEELGLIKILSRFPGVIASSQQAFAPHHLCEYLREVAAQFHKFYHDCRIMGSERSLQSARLLLALAAKRVLFNGMSILGVHAPERM